MEHTARMLAGACGNQPSYYSANVLQRVFGDGFHPRLDEKLDEDPKPYDYDETLHGPSRRTTAVRKLTRKKLHKIEPWAEEEVEPFNFDDDSDLSLGTVSAEELAQIEEDFFAAEGFNDEWD